LIKVKHVLQLAADSAKDKVMDRICSHTIQVARVGGLACQLSRLSIAGRLARFSGIALDACPDTAGNLCFMSSCALQQCADQRVRNGQKRGGRAGTADWPESVQLRCVENSVPCISCSAQNKGIAACFALGHLYVSNSGSLPSSCKDCKQRNKGEKISQQPSTLTTDTRLTRTDVR
jgi:hypothetical protein